jgi:hypothetical protein
MDRIQKIHLIQSLLTEVKIEDSGFGSNFDYLHKLTLRARMLATKIFGKNSHYLDDLKGFERIDADTYRNRLLNVCNTMLEDMQMIDFEESQKEHENQIAKKETASTLSAELQELKKTFASVTEELVAQARKYNSDMQQQALKGLNELVEQGFTFIDLDDTAKSNFHDLLKGFEDYAKLKGYEASVSVDVSKPNKLGFKFTFGGRAVTKDIRMDLQEYVAKVQSGDDLTDMPIVLPERQHQELLIAMRSRIHFLQFQVQMYKDKLQWQELSQTFLQDIVRNVTTNERQPIINVLQDNKPTLTQSVVVGSTPESRKDQRDALESLLAALNKQTAESGKPVPPEIIRPLENVKEELCEEKPDPKRVIKWLETAKDGLKALRLVGEVKDAAVAAYIAFNLIFS